MTDAHVIYIAPTHPLAHKPRREWDAVLHHDRRQFCSYCTHASYVFAPEVETGRYYCGSCVRKHRFVVKESDD